MAISKYEQDGPRVLSTAGRGETFAEIMARRLSRRGLIQGGVAASAMVLAAPVLHSGAQGTPEVGAGAPVGGSNLNFTAITPDLGDAILVAEGYTATPFLRWGDPLVSGLADFDPVTLTAEDQAKRIGYNHDFVGFLPLPLGEINSDHGLLVINHEYTNPELMFPGYMVPNPAFATPVAEGEEAVDEFVPSPKAEQVDVELEAHGIAVVEIQRDESGVWGILLDSPYNRRVTATTEMVITGPAAGADMLKTSADDTGAAVIGTLNNCSGGLTPWGTYVSCEENFDQYFGNMATLNEDDPALGLHNRIALPEAASDRQWELFLERFDVTREPNEAFRFGWTVEIDPYDATVQPKKRTALGRFKHEAVNLVVAPDGRIVVYSGDDARFEYVYKFVSTNAFNPDDRAANMDLLDAGTLSVAVFAEDGTGSWLPLTFGEGPLTAENGFTSQADVLINARGAADLLGATKMDRPEDIEYNPVNGKIYMVMTNNTERGTPDGAESATPSNPRPENQHGHIVEVTEDGNDVASSTFTWDIFMLCGDPTDESTYFAGFPKDQVSAISSPDNITFDMDGNLWISTDGQARTLEINDGLFAVPVDGPERGYLRQFFSAVTGSEVSGPIFTPDNTSLFLAIQHPGEGGTFEAPITRWPDGAGAPRPSLVVIQATDGRRIGGA
ncbi:MAG: PhoX family phosphatase [Thermomicrobiales bacterium]